MENAKRWSDFVLTGCAIVPVISLAFGHPELALFSHIVLLFGGLLTAGTENDAPFKTAGTEPNTVSDDRSGAPLGKALAPRTGEPAVIPLHMQSKNHAISSRRSDAVRKLK